MRGFQRRDVQLRDVILFEGDTLLPILSPNTCECRSRHRHAGNAVPSRCHGESNVHISPNITMCCAGVNPITPGAIWLPLKNPPPGPVDSS
jgi:hypothetical protein